MSTTELLIKSLEFARARTLGLLDGIEKEPDPQAILAWRPGPGRAHIGWQLMHFAVTEEIFATERLAPEREPHWKELWPRFRGGSTPDDDVPTVAMIRDVLKEPASTCWRRSVGSVTTASTKFLKPCGNGSSRSAMSSSSLPGMRRTTRGRRT